MSSKALPGQPLRSPHGALRPPSNPPRRVFLFQEAPPELKRNSRSDSGTLYEIQILIAILGIALAILVPDIARGAWRRGALELLLIIAGLGAGVALLIFVSALIMKVVESRPVQAVVGRPWVGRTGWALVWLAGAFLATVGGWAMALLFGSAFSLSDRTLMTASIAGGALAFSATAYGWWKWKKARIGS